MVEAGPDLRWETTRHITLSTIGANLLGAILVYLYLQFLAPGALTTTTPSAQFILTAALFPAYFVVVAVLISRSLRFREGSWQDKIGSGDALTSEDRRVALGLPFRLTGYTGGAWAGAALLNGAINLGYGQPLSQTLRVTIGILLGGVVTTSLTYLMAERGFRPVVVVALGGEPAHQGGVGIRARFLTAWLVGSALPLAAAGLVPFERHRGGLVSLPWSIASLAFIGVVAGYALIRAAATSVSEPLAAVRRALDAVRRGDLDAHVPVDDPGEIGRLEADVNRMVSGLRQRRRLEELFGRHVGEEVARQALAEEAVLGGQLRQVSVLFVDLIGSTRLAVTRPPDEVVTVLNRLFGCVVDVVTAEGGWVNKFEGDGAMCVFGVPVELPDHQAAALRAARRLRKSLAALAVAESALDAAIGVSSGPAVAGNVGARDRYEYTVIGDPVNEAARLSDKAKAVPGRLLASAAMVEAAGEPEAAHWEPRGEEVLRGRDRPTALMAPVEGSRLVGADQPPATAGTIETV